MTGDQRAQAGGQPAPSSAYDPASTAPAAPIPITAAPSRPRRPRTNLPAHPASFIGRSVEQATVQEQLVQDQATSSGIAG